MDMKKMKRDIFQKLNIWSIGAVIIAALLLFPNLVILKEIAAPINENWEYISKRIMGDYVSNTIIVVALTAVLTFVLGTYFAWIVSFYKFPGSKVFSWLLILPLVIPPYIGAYTYKGITGYGGTLERLLPGYKHVDIMNIWGAVFIYSLFLYPYVYIIVKSYFEKQASGFIDAARTMGAGSLEILVRILIPMARVPIVGGLSLVIMEVINDYGVVKYFGVQTMSTAIFKTWFSLGDIGSASKLAGILMVFVVTVLMIEKGISGRRNGSYVSTKIKPIKRRVPSFVVRVVMTASTVFIISGGLVIPILQLLFWSSKAYERVLSIEYLSITLNSFAVAVVSALIIVVFAMIAANSVRMNKGAASKIISKIIVMGYSVPGAIIAIGVLTVALYIDRRAETALSISIFLLIFAYVVRFISIGYNNFESGFEKIGNKFHESARTLGYSITQVFFKVDIKMMMPSVFAAITLVFIDVFKELPLALLLRPFNFDTLATKSFEYADNEMMPEASIAALILIGSSAMMLFILNKINKSHFWRGKR